MPLPTSSVPPAFQRYQRQAHRVCHPLCDRRQVHFCRPTVSFLDSIYLQPHHLGLPFPQWVVDLLWTQGSTEKRRAEPCCGREAYSTFCSFTVSGDNPFCLCCCFLEGAVHLDDIIWKYLLICWEVISHLKYSEAFYRISRVWLMMIIQMFSAHFHAIHPSLFLMSTILRHTHREREWGGKHHNNQTLPLSTLSQSHDNHRLFAARSSWHVMLWVLPPGWPAAPCRETQARWWSITNLIQCLSIICSPKQYIHV